VEGDPRTKTRVASGEENISIAELDDSVCMVQTMPRLTIIWRLVDSSKNIWVNAYAIRMDIAVYLVVPLTVLGLGRKLLFYYLRHYEPFMPVLQVYDPCLEICTDVKTPADVKGKIGLCRSHFDPRHQPACSLKFQFEE
jgi:hypothetical protein